MKRKIKMCLSLVITVFFVYYVATRISWTLFLTKILEVNILLLVLGVIVYFLCHFIRALRLRILLNEQDIKLNKLLSITLLHNFFNRILPARLGDFSLIYYLKKYSEKSLGSSINIFIILRMYDLFISIFLLTVSHIIVFRFNFISLLLVLCLLFKLILILNSSFVLSKLIKLLKKYFVNRKVLMKIHDKLILIYEINKLLENKRTQLYLFLYSFLIWFLILVLFWVLLLSINSNYGFFNTSFATTVANFSWVLPINGVGGFGTMELSWGYVFSFLGYDFNEVILSAFYINVIIFVATVTFAIVPYFYLTKRELKQ